MKIDNFITGASSRVSRTETQDSEGHGPVEIASATCRKCIDSEVRGLALHVLPNLSSC